MPRSLRVRHAVAAHSAPRRRRDATMALGSLRHGLRCRESCLSTGTRRSRRADTHVRRLAASPVTIDRGTGVRIAAFPAPSLRRSGALPAFRDRREQTLRVGLARVAVDLVGISRLDDPPSLITMISSAMYLTTARSCEMKMYESLNSSCKSCNRLSTCACTETSRAETDSSQISTSGFIVRQRAMAMRWRWPPENSWGYL